jgi:hypothetical protein
MSDFVERATKRLALGSSRRGLIAQAGRGIVALGVASVAGLSAAREVYATHLTCCGANSNCQGKCAGPGQPWLNRGQTGTSGALCNTVYGSLSGSCSANGYYNGWYWYCCHPNSRYLYKCQDCCTNGGTPTGTVTSFAGYC